MKNKRRRIACSILALVFSYLSAPLAYGFMGEAAIPFATKFICGLVFIMAPLFTTHLVILLLQRDK